MHQFMFRNDGSVFRMRPCRPHFEEKKTVLAKNAFLNKTRARKNICIQPWHQKFKTASNKQSGIRDMLIGKYDKLSAMLPNNLDVVVNNFKRNKVTLGKQT